jgi:hypothetical protein
MGEGSDNTTPILQLSEIGTDSCQVRGGPEMIELDEVSHEMLLGVMERYWVWSKS